MQCKCISLFSLRPIDDNYFQVFHTDDYELQLLQKGHCPFCRREILKLVFRSLHYLLFTIHCSSNIKLISGLLDIYQYKRSRSRLG